MSRWLFNRRFTHDTGRIARACVFVMLSLSLLAGNVSAQSIDPDWKTETRLYVSGITNYWARNDTSANYDTIAVAGELRFKSDARPWYLSLFADYHYSNDSGYTGQSNIGTYINYGWRRWDARAYAFVNESRYADNTWLYAGRLRYRINDDHKIGIETFSTFKNARSPQLMIGWYGDLTEKLSFTLAAGRGTGNGPDLSARLELVWQVF